MFQTASVSPIAADRLAVTLQSVADRDKKLVGFQSQPIQSTAVDSPLPNSLPLVVPQSRFLRFNILGAHVRDVCAVPSLAQLVHDFGSVIYS